MSTHVEDTTARAGPTALRSPSEPAPPSRAVERVLVPAIPTALAGALCAYGLTARSLGFDEAASVTIAAQHGAALGHALAHDGGNMSGYYVLLHVLIGWWGNGLAVVRIPSVVFSAATAGLVTALAQVLFDRRVALISGLLTAVSLPLVFWGQSARGYAPMIALTTASFLAFAVLVRRERQGRPTLGPAVAYGLAMALAAYASFLAVLVVPAQLLLLIGRRRALRPVLAALALCVLCWVPLVLLAISRGSGQLFWVPRPSLKVEGQVLDALSSAGLDPSFHRTGTTLALLLLTGLVVLAVAVRSVGAEGSWPRMLVLAWLVVPVLLAWLESLFGQSIFLPRNLLMVVPAVSVLLALGVTDRRVPWLAGAALLAALLVLRALQVGASYGVSPEDWKGAARYVLARAQSSDCVAFYPSDARMAFRYYLIDPAGAPTPILPRAPWRAVSPYVEDYATLTPGRIAALPGRCPRLWLISSHEGQADGPPGSRANYARFLHLRAALEARYPRRSIAQFGYASPIRVLLLTSGS